jgi:2'-5' RNA ligase
MADTIRTFIAIQLPQAVIAHLGQQQRSMAANLPDGAVRWVKPEKMHLTLNFLGDTPQSKIADVIRVMSHSAESHTAFNLFLSRTGCFPNVRRPRVFWAGIVGAIHSTEKLKQTLYTKLEPLGWEPERRNYTPHLTLGYIKDYRNLRGVPLPVAVKLTPLPIPVTAIHLVRSDLRPSGPVYTVLHTSPLH